MGAVRFVIRGRGRLEQALQFLALPLLAFDLVLEQRDLAGELAVGVMRLVRACALESRMPRSTTAWLMASVSVAFSAMRPSQMNTRLIARNMISRSLSWCEVCAARTWRAITKSKLVGKWRSGFGCGALAKKYSSAGPCGDLLPP